MPPVQQAGALLETLVVRDANPALTAATGAVRSDDGTFALPASGYLVLAGQAMLIAAVTAWASRRTLFATLDEID